MKTNFLRNKIGGALLGVSFMLGIGVASGVTTHAQSQDDRWRQDRRDDNYNDGRGRDDRYRARNQRWRRRNDDGYGNYGGSFQLRQTALNEGFNEGLKEGRKDRRRGEYYSYTDEREFQKGTKSFNSRLGSREIYSRYFREAFSHGYADGYAGY